MKKNIMRDAEGYAARRHRSRIWKRVVGVLACAVVFCTTYALILPAITMEKETCSLPEHTHTEACYTQVTSETHQEPVCSQESLNLHEHTESCYGENGELVCGYSDFVVHEHNSACYDGDGNLWCPLPEIKAHTHDESCYTQQSAEVHTHDAEACYTLERGELTCTEEESEGHTHSAEAGCYDENDELVCQLAESSGHQHTDDCYAWNKVLNCGLSTEPAEDAEPELICEKEEIILHTHGDGCFEENADDGKTLTCGKQEVLEHVHSESCFQTVETEVDTETLTCTVPEGEGAHTHGEECRDADGTLVCGLEESEGHQHSALCYGTWELTCTLEEHTHSEACMQSGIMTLSNLRIAQDVANALKEDGVYAYRQQSETWTDDDGNEFVTWTAMDGATESEARVKVEVTLPSGVTVPDNYYLFVREVEGKDDYDNYPNAETLKAYVGEVNDSQVYSIHWVEIDNKLDNGYRYNTESVLKGSEATIKLTYLKTEEDVVLNGHASERKLLIFSSSEDGTKLTEVGTMTGVTAKDDYYTGFTFTTKEAGPYVFVSQKVFAGYVSQVAVNGEKMQDGTSPFDSTGDRTEDGKIDVPGNDKSNDNQIVRSYDTILYGEVNVSSGARQDDVVLEKGTLWLEMSLEADLSEASIDIGQLSWMESCTFYYLNTDGNVLYWQDAEAYNAGIYYYLGDSANDPTPTTVSAIEAGVTGGNTATLNAILSGSTSGGNGVYTSNVVTQRVIGCKTVTASNAEMDKNILAGTVTVSAGVRVLNAANGSTIQPAFRAWWDGNETNYGSESGSGGAVVPAEPVTTNQTTAPAVTVSSAASFNLELAENKNVTYRGWFDLSTGQEITSSSTAEYPINNKTVTGAEIYALLEALAALKENIGTSNPEEFTDTGNACSSYLKGLSLGDYKTVFSGIRYGRITGYGLTLQVYNDVSNASGKGFKGTLLPVDGVSFALELSNEVTVSEGTAKEDQYYSVLWDYSENRNLRSSVNYSYDDPYIGTNGKVAYSSTTLGSLNRNMYWDSLAGTCYAQWAAAYNGLYASDATHSNYYGGTWSLADDEKYNFTVSGYDFNFSAAGLTFPTTKAGNAAADTGYNSYIGCFSSGQIQVLNVFPRYQTATVNMKTSVIAKNLTLETADGTKFAPAEGDETGYAQETNTSDNNVTMDIPLYKKGTITKANAFCSSAFYNVTTSTNIANSDYFLGTYFWGVNYDESAFAGQDITLVGAARINAGDYKIHSMNLLQLFDSSALTIDLGKGDPYVVSTVTGVVTGKTDILYAADPDYPDGYDTNKSGVMEYMSSVREEDLVYYTSLEDLEKAGYTCIGVLAELREWTIPGETGYSTVLKIPMTVTDSEDYLCMTVGTVNAVRTWTNENDMVGVSWENGTYDPEKKENSVEGYVTTNNDAHYSPKIENNSAYIKTEYENGQIKEGTNAGGYVYGNTLLILGYEAKVEIGIVDKESNPAVGYPTYSLDSGEYTVTYRLGGIIASVDKNNDGVGNAQDTTTELTVTAKLDEGNDNGMQRIAVSSSSYQMTSSDSIQLIQLDANGEPVYGEDGKLVDVGSVTIGKDSNNPTTVSYVHIDENGNVVTGSDKKPVVYTIKVYAQTDEHGTEVAFRLSDVTVGVSVPEITFDAEINQTAVSGGDSVTTNAYISGTSDVRAYTDVNGNMDSTTFGVIRLGSTQLIKAVDKEYIELDGTFTYTVTYTNGGTDPLDVIYLSDLLPDKNDNRCSGYNGALALSEVSAYLSGASTFGADVTFYYSTTPYITLRPVIDLTDADNRNVEKINTVLATYFKELGTISSGSSEVIYSKGFDELTDEEKKEITGIYIVVKNLRGGNSINLTLTVKTQGNEPADIYKNRAYSWLGTDTSGVLMSNLVSTNVISRSISGVVWYDSDLDGIRDTGEHLLENVTVTLFKWDSTQNKYVQVTEDIRGTKFGTTYDKDGNVATTGTGALTTGADGAYSFDKLPEGEYIVAFSGDVLAKYTGATVYQTDGGSDASNDGKAISELDTESISGIYPDQYAYFIHYSVNGSSIKLHSLKEIATSVTLNGGVEDIDHQDLGVVISGHELPNTGGAGTIPYTVAGLVLVIGTGAILMLQYRKRRRADS